ncbi:Uncharacterised protein [Candidatus Norongarragalina meridionalis]|nr:Uncharacterised protein [Candidatus Norongarragalina meridionalis]
MLARIAEAALERLEDADGGFFDSLYLRDGAIARSDTKKANYNAVCAIALLDRWKAGRMGKHVDYLVGRCESNDFLVPSFEGKSETTWGEQGLLLWALAKAEKKGFRNARRAAEGMRRNIASAATARGLPHDAGSDWHVPMDNAFVLDGLVECGDMKTARVFAQALLRACSPPVFAIERGERRTGRISFNNIVYPIHALSRYCLKSGDSATEKKLRAASEGLLGLQGTLGQWWWTYDSAGGVAQRYPVYAVHQDGMAVMALRMASRVFPDMKPEAEAAITRGIAWLRGGNELGESLVDEKRGVIWRSIRCPPIVQKINRFLPWFPEFGLRIKRESRSYHYGWLLYGDSL